jgi:hypothetical protein
MNLAEFIEETLTEILAGSEVLKVRKAGVLFQQRCGKTAGGGSILGQDVDFAKLFLNLLDSLDAIRVSFSDIMGRQGRPAPIARYDRNRD